MTNGLGWIQAVGAGQPVKVSSPRRTPGSRVAGFLDSGLRRNDGLTRSLALATALALLAGCASLPDITPYRDATVQLRSTVLVGGHAVESGLLSAAASLDTDAEKAQQLKGKSDQFAKDWRVRVEAVDGLVAYAEAINGIALAGSEGAASARTLADSLTRLVTSMGITLPAAGTLATATDAAAFVYGHIAAARAAQSLDQALASAQPVVDRVALLLAKDLQASMDVLRAAHEIQRTAIVSKYNNELGYLQALNKERAKLYAKGSLEPAEEQRLRQIAELYEATKDWREPMEKMRAESEATLKARMELISATQAAVAEWAAAHGAIAVAVKEKRKVNVEALVQATLEARELIRRLRTP